MKTREELVRIIKDGGSVSYNGRIYTTEAELPQESELSADDPARRAAEVANIDAQIDRLMGQRARLAPAPAEAAPADAAPAGEAGPVVKPADATPKPAPAPAPAKPADATKPADVKKP